MSAASAAEPSWSWTAPGQAPAQAELAARAFASLDDVEQQLARLVLGLGADFGSAAAALGLDPSVANWRLGEGLRRVAQEAELEPGVLERGLSHWLRAGDSPPWPTLQRALPPTVCERLATRQAAPRGADALEPGPGGLGIGSLALVVLAAFVFLAYGILRDENPLWRGRALARQGEYAKARSAFTELGPAPEARAWTALCWLAEGEFERALALLRDSDAGAYLGNFRPMEERLAPVEHDPDSPALLPRGLVFVNRPRFVFKAASEGTLELRHADDPGAIRPLRWTIPDSAGADALVHWSYPESAGGLKTGTYVWTAPGGENHPAAFTVISREQARELQLAVQGKLGYEIPNTARIWLRAQFDLRQGLLQQAGDGYAQLVRLFPEQEYPRKRLADIARALGVDPAAFLR